MTFILTSAAVVRAETQVASLAAKDSELEELVVYAQRRAQPEQSIPLAVTALSGAQIEARGRSGLAELAPLLPNTVLVLGTSPNGPALGAQIRGIGQFDFNPAYEPGVAIYVDDVYYPLLTGSAMDLLDIASVEVARGPQGTLSGRNAIGGAIYIRTRMPDGEDGVKTELRLGSRQRLGLRASAGARLSDKVSARFAFVRNRQDGYVDQLDFGCTHPDNPQGIAATRPAGDCRVDRLGGVDYTGARARLRFRNERLDFTLSSDITRVDQSNPAEVLTVARDTAYLCGARCTYASYGLSGDATLLGSELPAPATTQSNQQFFRSVGVSGQLSMPLGDLLKLDSITAFRDLKSTFGADDDLSPQPAGGGGSHKLDHYFLSQEIRISADQENGLTWLAGVYASRQVTTYITQQDIRYLAPGKALQFVGDDRIEAGSMAVFATATFAATDKTNILAGVRQSWDYKDYRFTRRNADGSINAYLDPVGAAYGSGYVDPITGIRALDGSIGRYRGSHFDWRVGVDHRLLASTMVYATVSTGFRGGGVSARPFNARQAVEGIFNPESIRSYEIGLKSDLLDRRLRFNVAAFLSRHKNALLALRDCSNFGGGPCGVIANAGNAQLEGLEVEMTARPATGWEIRMMASHVDGTWKRLDNRVGTSVSLSDPSTSSPPWKLAASLSRTFELRRIGQVSLRVDHSYTGKRFNGRAIAATPYYIPSHHLVDTQIGWTAPSGQLEAALLVTNLFQATYLESRTDVLGNFTGNAFGRISAPREVMLTVKYSF